MRQGMGHKMIEPTPRSPPIPKRHHFVPLMLLRRFTNPDGRLWFYDKARAHRGVQLSKPEQLFVRSHLYSEIEDDGSKDPAVEAWLSELEARASSVVGKIITSARRGRLPGLTPEERVTLDDFIVMQWRRVPELHDTVTTPAEVSDALDEIVGRLIEQAPHRAHEAAFLDDPDYRERFIRNARVGALPQIGPEVRAVMAARSLGVVHLPGDRKSFIMGSRPVVMLDVSDLRKPGSEMWLPVASDVAVGNFYSAERESLLHVPDAAVRQVNMVIARQSGTIAGRSQALVASLASQR